MLPRLPGTYAIYIHRLSVPLSMGYMGYLFQYIFKIRFDELIIGNCIWCKKLHLGQSELATQELVSWK